MLVPLMPLELLRALDVDTLRALLAAYGAPREVIDAQALSVILDPPPGTEIPRLSARVIAALELFNALASWRGREAVFDAADALHVDLTTFAAHASDAELAARLLTAAASDPALVELCNAAAIDLRQTVRPEPFRVFHGASRRAPRVPSAADLVELARDLDREAQRRSPSSPAIVRVFGARDGSGRVGVELSRDRARALTDLAVVDPRRGWLLLRPSQPWLLPFLRRRMGLLFYGDEAWFGCERAVDLEPLRERGRAALAVPALAATVVRSRLIRLVWDKGERGLTHLDAADVFDELAETGKTLARGQLRAATIRLTFAAGSPATVDVTFEIPNRLYFEPSPHDALVESYLDASGLLGGGQAPADLWSLAPWIHPRVVWTAKLGAAAFSALVEGGVIARTQSRALAHPDHPDAGRALIAFPLAGDRHYGVSEHVDVPCAVLTAADLETWQLDPVALGARLAKDLELTGRLRAIEREPGLVDLGARVIGSAEVRMLLAAARPGDASLHDVLASLPGRVRPVVLVPRGRGLGPAVPVAVVEPTATAAGALREVVLALGLEDDVESIVVAPLGSRFVVDRARELTWLDGVPLALNGTDFALLTALVAASGALVAYGELAKRVGAGPRDGSSVPKQKYHLLASVRASFDAKSAQLPEDFEKLIESAASQHAYRLTVPSFVR